jgi:NAD(P)-dependent dehydrogenase (short-subunit alcohol dehydrogenase family)
MSLEGRSAVLTGAGTGIGRACALHLARLGCDIGILDIDTDAAEATAQDIRALGQRAFVETGSVAAPDDVTSAIPVLADALGKIDILVNNAGILRTAPFLETDHALWRKILDINLDGAFHVCREVLPLMVVQGRGAVVNMASWTGKKGVANHSAYCASKFGLIGLTQTLALEMAPHGIRVNAVCPGVIVDTAMRDAAEEMNRAQGLPDVATRVRNTIPLARAGVPDDVAEAVGFLASDASSYMTGQAINVTGGLWMN